jgi:hypothetical protein
MNEVLSWNNLNVEEQPLEKIQTNQQVLTWDSLNTNQEEIDNTTVVKSENVLSWDNLDAKPVEESKISEEINIEFVNEHPKFEQTGGFDIRNIPDFESIEDASAWYGLPVEQLKKFDVNGDLPQERGYLFDLIPEHDQGVQFKTGFENVDIDKKYIPTLNRDPKYEADGSFDPFDEYKSDWSISSEAFKTIWEDELGINKDNLKSVENPILKNTLLYSTDVADAIFRSIATVIYGTNAGIGDTVTNITGDSSKGEKTFRDLNALFEGTLPMQMGTGMASVRSWGNTVKQVNKFNKEGKKIIDDYVAITFKDSPNKVKIKNELNKKFDEGAIKSSTILKQAETNVGKILANEKIPFKKIDDLNPPSRFKEPTTAFDSFKDPTKLWQFSESPILRGIDRVFGMFRSRGNKTPEMQRLYDTFQAKIRGNNSRAIALSKNIERSINSIIKTTKRSEQKTLKAKLLDDIQKVLIGTKSIDEIDVILRPVVGKTRNLIDDLSKQLLQSEGLGAGSSSIKKIINNNIGQYLRQSYKLFEEGGFKPSRSLIQKAFDYISKENPALSKAEVEGIINKIISKGDNKSVASLIESLPKKSQNIFLKRKEIPLPIRELMGEIKDPRFNLINTVNNLTKWLEADKYFTQLKRQGANKYFFKKPTGRFYKPIEGKQFNPLNGWHTSPEIANIIQGMDQLSMGSGFNFYKPFLYAKGFSQTMKTVFNHVTQIRNVQGGALMTMFNGLNPFSNTGFKAIKIVLNDIGRMKNEAFNLKFQEYLDLGIVRTSVKGRELQAIFKDIQGMQSFDQIRTFLSNKILKYPLKVAKKFEDVYMGVDDIFKIIVYEKELATLQKAYPTTNISRLKQMASNITVNTMPTYDKVPTSIKMLRRLPLGNFVSFPAESIRTAINSIIQAGKELKTNNNAIRIRGAKRLAGNIVIGGFGMKILNEGFNTVNGFTEDALQAVKQFVPEWSENSNIILLNDDPKNIQYLDLSYTYPYDIFHRPIQAIINQVMEGKEANQATDTIIKNSVTDSLYEFFKPFVEESMLTEALLDISRNQTNDGREIYNPQSPFGDQIAEQFYHVMNVFLAGGIPQVTKLYKSINEIKEPYGKEYDTQIELIANLAGTRVSEINILEAFNFKIPEFNEGVKNSERLFRSVANDQNVVPSTTYINSYLEAEKSRYKNFSDMYVKIQSALELGVSRRDIVNTLMEKNISKDDIGSLLRGIYIPYFPSNDTLYRIKTSGNTFPKKEIREIYSELARIPLNDFTTFNKYLEKGLSGE